MYDLPADRIAAFPAGERDGSRLLIYRSGEIIEDRFPAVKRYLPQGAMLVFNNTRVIHARLRFQRPTGAMIEILCLEPSGHQHPELSFRSTQPVVWNCIVGNLRKWKEADLSMTVQVNGKEVTLKATKQVLLADAVEVMFSWDHPDINFADILEKAGELPIPPYLNRETMAVDELRYNTVYAEKEGSVAAPTAGLHFTETLIDELKSNGAAVGKVTLHVGAGTFKPVKSGPLFQHEMHEERIVVTLGFLQQLCEHISKGKPVIPVGTTAVRTLESLYWLGVKLISHPEWTGELMVEQWLPYQETSKVTAALALQSLIQ